MITASLVILSTANNIEISKEYTDHKDAFDYPKFCNPYIINSLKQSMQ